MHLLNPLSPSGRILSESILEEHDQNASAVTNSNSEERIKRIITTLGELAMLSYRRITHRLFLLLQSIAFFKVYVFLDANINLFQLQQQDAANYLNCILENGYLVEARVYQEIREPYSS